MKIKLEAPIGISEIGSLSRQEDKIYPLLSTMSASDRVFVMCDGLGGHAHGDVASAVVSKALTEWTRINMDFTSQPTALTIRHAVAYAQQHLDDTNSRFEASRYPMGTTMAMLVIGDFGAVAAHIGDTRVYHIRPSRREILYRSRDHSLVNDLFVAGRITRAEAEASPKKSVLSRAMLPAPCPVSSPDVAFITDIEAGDYFVMCTDGIIEAVSDKKLKDVLCNEQYSNAQKVASLKLLTDAVPSNHSLILLQVASVEKDAADYLLVNTERMMCDKMVRRSVMLAPAVAVSTPSVEIKPTVDSPEEVLPPTPVIADALESNASVNEPGPVESPPAVASTQQLATKDKKSSNRLFWLIVAALLLAIAIASIFLLSNKRGGDEKMASETSKSEESKDPDVIISKDVPNDVMPDDPLDTFPTGSNVAVTPAPTVGDLPTPNTHYDTGSNVRVPRVKEGDPYPDAFDNKDDYKDLDKDVPKTADDDDDDIPAQPAQKNTGGVPPPKKQVSNDPANSNRNVAVPPPPGKKRNVNPY